MDALDSPASPASQPPLSPQAQDAQPLELETGDVIMMNPPPSPPPPVAGAKREMVGAKAFALENVKAARVNNIVRMTMHSDVPRATHPDVSRSRTFVPSLGTRSIRILPLHRSLHLKGVVSTAYRVLSASQPDNTPRKSRLSVTGVRLHHSRSKHSSSRCLKPPRSNL